MDYARMENLRLQEIFFNGIPSKGLQPSIHMYKTITGLLCEEGIIEEAKCLLKEMEKSGCAPDSVTYEVIIKGLLNRNEFSEAKAFLDEMRRRGLSLNSSEAMNIDLGAVAR
ncbi:UNVERIFIED_CONTAM: hypothetical protein Scaly_0820200 [Sesamum calycinum]|uniref:Pentatricopeptide repeat-containing protein n=1 Tax=Sesamum calycinum TaxID=2727403 RepID=A0AAW2RB55_9LAMI